MLHSNRLNSLPVSFGLFAALQHLTLHLYQLSSSLANFRHNMAKKIN